MNAGVKKTLHLIMATALSVAIFTGCGIKDEVEDTLTEMTESIDESLGVATQPYEGSDGYVHSEEIDFDEIPEEFKDIDASVYDTVPIISSITREQLFDLSVDQFRAFISLYAPDYRNLYKIDEDMAMEDSDWETLRVIVSYQLYGTIKNPNLTDDEYETQTIESLEEAALVKAQDYASGEEDVDDEDYAAQLEEEKQSILEMDRDSFVAYINDIFAQVGYTNEDGSAIDISDMDDETVEEMRESIVADIDAAIEELGSESDDEDESIQEQIMDSAN